jgi:hypothetical protein
MAFIDKSTQWTVTKESAYGDQTAPALPDDFVELINPSMAAATEMIDREVMKNSMVKAQPLLGKETSSGSMEVELSTTTGTPGALLVNGDLLYESAMGHRIGDVPETSGTISSGVITFTTATDCDNYEVGQAVKCTGGATTQYAVVRSISAGVSMTVSPAPADDQTTFGGLVSFTVARPEDTQISLSVQEYMESGAARIEYTYGGVIASDVSIAFPVANIVKATFSLAGAGFTVEEDGVNGGVVAARTPVCKDLSPYVAKNMSFIYDSVSYDIENLEAKVTSDIYDTEALTTAGITDKTATGKSEVGGTFGVEYTGSTLFSKFQAGTSGELFGTVSNANGTAVLYAPKVVLTASDKSKDSGIYKEALTYTCLSSDTCSAASEDAITIAFE